MTFQESIKTVFKKYSEFNGVAKRDEFWWWMLFNALVLALCNVFSVLPIGDNSSWGLILSGVWSVATLLPNLAVSVRRLRDAGHHWANLFFALVPVAGIVILIVFWVQPTATKK